jgi:acetyltransferase-like isoleucine patch superfamily enzyme
MVGENCVVGMGSVVTKNTEADSTYIGSPARKK